MLSELLIGLAVVLIAVCWIFPGRDDDDDDEGTGTGYTAGFGDGFAHGKQVGLGLPVKSYPLRPLDGTNKDCEVTWLH